LDLRLIALFSASLHDRNHQFLQFDLFRLKIDLDLEPLTPAVKNLARELRYKLLGKNVGLPGNPFSCLCKFNDDDAVR
jgi:hypothetical protein